MTKIAWMTGAVLIIWSSFTACAGSDDIVRSSARQEKKEARRIMRADRKARALDMKLSQDRNRIDKENYRQVKKMNRAARKENKGRKYDENHLGNVFGL